MQFSARDKWFKFQAHFPIVKNISKDFTVKQFQEMLSKLPDDLSSLVIEHNPDDMYSIIFTLLVKNGRYESFQCLNAYDVIDIYLGHWEEKGYKCLSDIESKILVVYFHGSEMENRRQEDLISQLFEQQKLSHGKFWLLAPFSIKSKYPVLSEFLSQRKAQFLNLKHSKVSDEEEI